MPEEDLVGLLIHGEEDSACVTPAPRSLVDQSAVTSHISVQVVYAGREETMGEVPTTLPPSIDDNISGEELQSYKGLLQTESQQEKQRARRKSFVSK